MADESGSQINGIAVIYCEAGALKPHSTNPNSHSAKQVERIARSISDYGWTNPIIVDENDSVLSGHGRLLAAAKLGIKEVPTICLRHMTSAQKRAYVIADNRLAEIGGTWDRKLLALEHEAIQLLDPAFDLTATGFDECELEIMFDTLHEAGEDTAIAVDRSARAIARVGDLWRLGRHRLYCGNALEEASFIKLLEGEQAHLVVVDAPYNVKVGGHCVGKGKHREFVMASGEMTRPQFAHFLKTAFDNLRACPYRNKLLDLHPTVKPIALISDAIKDCSRKNGLVLDCFAGSGTVIIASERTGRRAAAIELDPHYVDTAIERWQTESGQAATLDQTGASFAQLRQERRHD